MKVKELIKALQKKNPESNVYVKEGTAQGWYTDNYISIKSVKVFRHNKFRGVTLDSSVSNKYDMKGEEEVGYLLY